MRIAFVKDFNDIYKNRRLYFDSILVDVVWDHNRNNIKIEVRDIEDNTVLLNETILESSEGVYEHESL